MGFSFLSLFLIFHLSAGADLLQENSEKSLLPASSYEEEDPSEAPDANKQILATQWGESLIWNKLENSRLFSDSVLLATVSNNKAFDPFIDYGEFQDNVTEEESLSFFQHGRSLSVILEGGYEGLTLNMRQIYGDSLFYLGLNISFFVDFHIAFQVNGMFPTGHYNSLLNTDFTFYHLGIDFKYFWRKQYLNEEQPFFNPYFLAGPFLFNLISDANSLGQANQQQGGGAVPLGPGGVPTTQELNALPTKRDVGLKTGLGLELNIFPPVFISFEATYLYVNFPYFENRGLNEYIPRLPPLPDTPRDQTLLDRIQFYLKYPQRPNVRDHKFFGDLFHITFQVGLNF